MTYLKPTSPMMQNICDAAKTISMGWIRVPFSRYDFSVSGWEQSFSVVDDDVRIIFEASVLYGFDRVVCESTNTALEELYKRWGLVSAYYKTHPLLTETRKTYYSRLFEYERTIDV